MDYLYYAYQSREPCKRFFGRNRKTASSIFYAEMLDLFPCMVGMSGFCEIRLVESGKETNPNRRVSVISTTSPAEDFDADVLVINYDILGRRTEKNRQDLYRNKAGRDEEKTFSLIIADEIHFLKNRRIHTE